MTSFFFLLAFLLSLHLLTVSSFTPPPTVRPPYSLPFEKYPPPTPIAPYDWTDTSENAECHKIVRKCKEEDGRYRKCLVKEGCEEWDWEEKSGGVEKKVICKKAERECRLFLAHCVSPLSLSASLDCADFMPK